MCKGPTEFGGPARCAADARVNLGNQNRIYLEALRHLRSLTRALAAVERAAEDGAGERRGSDDDNDGDASLVAAALGERESVRAEHRRAQERAAVERDRLLVRALEYDATDEGLSVLEARRAAMRDQAQEAEAGGRGEHAALLTGQQALVEEQIGVAEAMILAERGAVAARWATPGAIAQARMELEQAEGDRDALCAAMDGGSADSEGVLVKARRGVARARGKLAALERLSAAPRAARTALVPEAGEVARARADVDRLTREGAGDSMDEEQRGEVAQSLARAVQRLEVLESQDVHRAVFSGVGVAYRATVDRRGAPVFEATLSCSDMCGVARTQAVTLPRQIGGVAAEGAYGRDPYAPVVDDGGRGSALPILMALAGQSRDFVLCGGSARGFRARTGLGREEYERAVRSHKALVALLGWQRTSVEMVEELGDRWRA